MNPQSADAAVAWDDLDFPPELFAEPDDDGEWRYRALCAETDPEAFFPEKGGDCGDARQICLMCPVRAECLEYALTNDERFGVWGGLSERERRRLKHNRRSP